MRTPATRVRTRRPVRSSPATCGTLSGCSEPSRSSHRGTWLRDVKAGYSTSGSVLLEACSQGSFPKFTQDRIVNSYIIPHNQRYPAAAISLLLQPPHNLERVGTLSLNDQPGFCESLDRVAIGRRRANDFIIFQLAQNRIPAERISH